MENTSGFEVVEFFSSLMFRTKYASFFSSSGVKILQWSYFVVQEFFIGDSEQLLEKELEVKHYCAIQLALTLTVESCNRSKKT